MAAEQFPEYGFYKVLESDEDAPICGFSESKNQQLNQVVVTLYKHGTLAGTERLRVSLYADAELTKKISTGDWFELSVITDQYWRGRIGLTISTKPWIKSGTTYYIGIESDGYTRNGDTFYLSFLMNNDATIIENSRIALMSTGHE